MALAGMLPIAGWLPRYDRSRLRGDVAAGIAVTALIVPKDLGYAAPSIADESFDGVVVLRLDSGLFFATSQALEDRVREFAEDDGAAPLRGVVLDFGGVNFIDSQGAEQLVAIQELVASHDATPRLARVKPNVLAVLSADGFVERLGGERIHDSGHRAVEAR